jgi:hypothetical protein
MQPLVDEANWMAYELDRKIQFNIKISNKAQDGNSIAPANMQLMTEIVILVANLEDKTTYEWTTDKFENRVFMMRDMLEEFYENDELPKVDKELDPFWDPPNMGKNKTDRLKGVEFKKNVADD